jgi:DNA-binding MarR family transcriptional regulator
MVVTTAIIRLDITVRLRMIVHAMRTIVETRDDLIGSILSDVGWSLRELRCASTEKFVKQGISMTQIHVLRQLEQHGTMSMSRVAELLDVSLSNATGIIDRMAERGLVERVRVPDDRRVVLVQPSALGIQALDETEGIKLDRIRAICNRLDDVQLRRITHAMGDLRVAIAAEFEMDSEEAHQIHQDSTSAG